MATNTPAAAERLLPDPHPVGFVPVATWIDDWFETHRATDLKSWSPAQLRDLLAIVTEAMATPAPDQRLREAAQRLVYIAHTATPPEIGDAIADLKKALTPSDTKEKHALDCDVFGGCSCGYRESLKGPSSDTKEGRL